MTEIYSGEIEPYLSEHTQALLATDFGSISGPTQAKQGIRTFEVVAQAGAHLHILHICLVMNVYATKSETKYQPGNLAKRTGDVRVLQVCTGWDVPHEALVEIFDRRSILDCLSSVSVIR
jgi:hypothetical protein